MAISLQAYVDRTEDGGFDLYDRVGAVIIHIDGGVLQNNPRGVELKKLREADTYRGPFYEVDIEAHTPVTVQHWTLQSVQSGLAEQLLEADDA